MDPTTRQRQKQCLKELQEAIVRLETEWDDDRILSPEEMDAQHAAIERLDEHFAAVENRFDNLRALWRTLRAELGITRDKGRS